MLGLILRALASRRAATLTLLVLTVLSAGAAAAAPQYVAKSMGNLAQARAEAAPVSQRVLSAQTRIPGDLLSPGGIDAFAREVADALPLPGVTRVSGLQIAGTASGERGSTSSGLYYREGVCDQLTIDGDCPARVGEAVISAPTAAALGVEVGDEFAYSFPGADPAILTVSGLYRANDPFADYWAGRRLVGLGTPEDPGSAERAAAAGVFTTIETIVAGKPREGAATVEAIAGSGVFAVTPPLVVRDAVDRAQAELLDRGYESQVPLRPFAIGVYNSQVDIVRSVPVSLLELLAICWVALYLAVRHGAQERRRDIGLLKLRGSGRGRMLLLALGQSAVPMLIGGVVGLAAALPLRPAPGTVDAATARQADALSLVAVAVAVLGALVAAAIAERRALTAPVALLMRAVPPRRTGWRYGTIDGGRGGPRAGRRVRGPFLRGRRRDGDLAGPADPRPARRRSRRPYRPAARPDRGPGRAGRPAGRPARRRGDRDRARPAPGRAPPHRAVDGRRRTAVHRRGRGRHDLPRR